MPAADPTLEARLSKAEADLVTLKARDEIRENELRDLRQALRDLFKQAGAVFTAAGEGSEEVPSPGTGGNE
jgi:chaperonin cofactor prefoldin